MLFSWTCVEPSKVQAFLAALTITNQTYTGYLKADDRQPQGTGRSMKDLILLACLFMEIVWGQKSRIFPKWRISGVTNLCMCFTKVNHKNKNKWQWSKSNRFHMSFRECLGSVLQTYLSIWYYVISRWWEVSHIKKKTARLILNEILLACLQACSQWDCGTMSSSRMTNA